MRAIWLASLAWVVACFPVAAEPVRLGEAQMDQVTAAGRPVGIAPFPFKDFDRSRVVVFVDDVVIIIKRRDLRRIGERRFDRVIVPPLLRGRFETVPRFHDFDRRFDGRTGVRLVLR